MEMTFGKMKLLLAAIAATAVVASLAFAAVAHNKAVAVTEESGAYHTFGPDGHLIGSAGNAGIRSQWQQQGLPE
jgi:opacity protein-like surface antigen